MINIKTNYSSQIKNDDMWVDVRDFDKRIIFQYFFTRTKDKEGYINVNIPPVLDGGNYYISIHRYENGVPRVVRQGIFQISKVIGGEGSGYIFYIIWFIVIILFILFVLYLLYLLYFVILPRIFKRKNKSE